jgi:hypothetical protein
MSSCRLIGATTSCRHQTNPRHASLTRHGRLASSYYNDNSALSCRLSGTTTPYRHQFHLAIPSSARRGHLVFPDAATHYRPIYILFISFYQCTFKKNQY